MCTYNYSCRLRLNLNFLSGKRCHSLSHSHSRHAAARTRVASERVGCGCGAGSGAAAPAPMRHAAKETWRRRWRLERETHRCDCIDLGSDGLRRPHDRDAWIGQGSSRGPNTARWTPTRFGFSQSSSPFFPPLPLPLSLKGTWTAVFTKNVRIRRHGPVQPGEDRRAGRCRDQRVQR